MIDKLKEYKLVFLLLLFTWGCLLYHHQKVYFLLVIVCTI